MQLPSSPQEIVTYKFKTLIGTRFSLSGKMNGWKIAFCPEILEDGLEIATWHFERITAAPPPELELSFTEPQQDMQIKWIPLNTLSQSHHYLPYWGEGSQVAYSLVQEAPLLCCLNQQGINRFAVVFSEAKQPGVLTGGGHEDGNFIVKLRCFTMPSEPVTGFTFSLYIDRRPHFYAETLADISHWYTTLPGYEPALVPAAAEEPLYSTWYQYQKAVSQAELERELPLIAESGMKTIIIDDGWQCALNEGGGLDMSTCGEWRPFPGKFPDLGGLAEKCHEHGVKLMLWFAVPFVGKKAETVYERFQEKYLSVGNDVCVLDPRYPEVREYLAGIFENAVKEWDIDGLKLDFMDSFRLGTEDQAAVKGYRGCDTRDLPEAVEGLLSDIYQRLLKLKPEILIEFRQHYTGPGMRCYGNIFRASDCAFDLFQNRVRTVDLRLLAGNTAVHSDMVIWSPSESPEVAARQLLNVLFSVPQVSLKLQELSKEHRKMLKSQLAFWNKHKKTLLHGHFKPEHPEHSYPVIRAIGKDETIIAVYEPGKVVRIPAGMTFLVNATPLTEVFAELPGKARVEYVDVFGESVGVISYSAGLCRLEIPQSGFAIIQGLPTG